MADTLESILGLTETTTTVMPESVVEEEENSTLEDILGIKPIIPAAEPVSPQVAPSINTLEDILNLTPEVATRKVVPQGPQSSIFIDLDKHFA